jgi:hypothetical protein
MTSGTPRGNRLLRLRVVWLPLVLIVLDGILLIVALLLAVVLVPLIVLGLLVALLIRGAINVLSGGRWWTRRRTSEEVAELEPSGLPRLTHEQRRELAMRYRPCLVFFPEESELGPPYRTGELANLIGADYHPRDVAIFLDHVRLRRGHTQWLPDLPETTEPAAIRASLGEVGESRSSLEIPWLHGGDPLKILRHLFPFSRQLRAHWAIPVPKADCGCSQVVWDRYIQILRDDAARPESERRYPHTIYARVLEAHELPEIGESHPLADAVAVQYWWFLFYNDAWNRHQGDWEGITVFLRESDDTVVPVGAAYGCHDLGRWRRWQDVTRVDEGGSTPLAGNSGPDEAGTHPLVYAARGSHASYFDHNENGYHPSMSRRLRIPFFGEYSIPSQFVLETRNAIDWVADAHSGLSCGVAVFTENVRVMPPEHILRDLPALRADDEWWWLAYRGLWGAPEFLPFFGGSGPRGPQWQGTKWSNPFRWMMRECIADETPYWLEMFAGWEPAPAPNRTTIGADESGDPHTPTLPPAPAGGGQPRSTGAAPDSLSPVGAGDGTGE